MKEQPLSPAGQSALNSRSNMEPSAFWATCKAVAWAGFGAVASFLAPHWMFILTMLCCLLLDMYTGIQAAKAREERIRGDKKLRTFHKGFTYICWCLLLQLVEQVFQVPDAVDLSSYMFLILTLKELKSISRNAKQYTGIDVYAKIEKLLPDLEKVLSVFKKKSD